MKQQKMPLVFLAIILGCANSLAETNIQAKTSDGRLLALLVAMQEQNNNMYQQLNQQLENTKKQLSVQHNTIREQNQQIDSLQQQIKQTAATKTTNVRQCSRRDVNNSGQNGLIIACAFTKHHDGTALRVVYNGDMRLIRRSTSQIACRRWYFTINNQECKDPASIDVALYNSLRNENIHRPVYLEGLCKGIPRGRVEAKFHIGGCSSSWGSFEAGDAYTGWRTTTRIILEEIAADDIKEIK